MDYHSENFQFQDKANKFRTQLENSKFPNPKRQNIPTEQLIEKLDMLSQKGHKQPNESLIESKSSMSQKYANLDDDTSYSQMYQRQLNFKDQNLFSQTNTDSSAFNHQFSNFKYDQSNEKSKMLLSQFSQSSSNKTSNPHIESKTINQESLFDKNGTSNLMEDSEQRHSCFSNNTMKNNVNLYSQDSSFGDFQDGQIQLPSNDIKIVPGVNYQGIQQQTGDTEQHRWYSQVKYSQLYKFPIIKSHLCSNEQDNIFAKCNKNIEFAIEQIHQNSPFKKGQLSQNNQQPPTQLNAIKPSNIQVQIQQSKKKQNAKSFQSEDVLDTLEEMVDDEKEIEEIKDEPTQRIVGHDIDQAIENSLNKSHLTMEDNNKAQKQKRQTTNSAKESVTSANNFQPPRLSKGQLSLIQNEKIFELRMDEFNNETSFDTLTSERLFQTCTEDQFPLTTQRQISNKHSKVQMEQPKNNDDSLIEQELKKISKNLNTFTVEHFNNLRAQIQKIGFLNASQKAKRDFNLITAESLNTLISARDEDNEISITEESRIQNQFHNMYANSTTASKNLYHKNEMLGSEKLLQELKLNQAEINGFDDKTQICNPLSPLLRKVIICELITQRNHSMIEVIHSAPCSGFNASPQILYSDNDEESRAFIDKNQTSSLILAKLMTPDIMSSMIKSQVTWLSCGFEHCLALTTSGQVASWGYGASGCLGHGDYQTYTKPRYIENSILDGKYIVYAEAGGYHNAAIDQYGNLFTWGRSDVGQLGFTKGQLQKDQMGYVQIQPNQLSFFTNLSKRIKQVALGEAHTIVLDHEGQVYSFGWGEHGQLGVKISETSQDNQQFTINKIQFFERFPCIKICAGSVFSAALTELHGKIYVWGSGKNGQLGLGNIKNSMYPTCVDYLANEKILDISCGDSHVLALSEKGKVYGWGQGITQSISLIKNLKESSSQQQQYSSYGINEDFHQNNRINSKTLDVICSLPKMLNEVEIAHTFLLRKKRGNSNDQQQQQLQSLQQQTMIQAKKQLMAGQITRQLPSNNTICEVSEKDSDQDERSRVMKKNEIKSTLITSQSSMMQNNMNSNSSQISSSLSKFGNQYDPDYKMKIESLHQDVQLRQKRSQSPQVVETKSIQDTKNFGVKKGSITNPPYQPLIIENPHNFTNGAQNKTQTPIQMINSAQTQNSKGRVNRNEILSRLEEFTHSQIQQADQVNESNIKQYQSMSGRQQVKNQIKNLAIQSSLGPRNHQKLQIQTSNSIMETSSAKKVKHITSVAHSDMILNSSQNINIQTHSNNSSRASYNRDSDQLQRYNVLHTNPFPQPSNNQSTIKRVRSPQPDQIMANKLKSSRQTTTASYNTNTTKKANSPGKLGSKVKNTPTPRNHIQIQSLQTYSSQSVLGKQAQTQPNKTVLQTQPQSTRNKNHQLKIASQNTISSNTSFKKQAINTTSLQNLQQNEVSTSTRASGQIIQTMMSPTSETHKLHNSKTTKSSQQMGILLSPRTMLLKAQGGVLNLNDTLIGTHQKQQSLSNTSSAALMSNISNQGIASVFNFKEKQSQQQLQQQQAISNLNNKPRGPKIGMAGSGQQYKLGPSSAKVSPKSTRYI
ncbi:UNKNOWN [Stylonychia lemnae]|uniref:RCC1-like domain-containing protein n=1 Tax=Stylonychia lemnae TaxID=5949 RepID=A0A078AR02_STYLE|nr:UNKNOWN [Stylonychia lemnae]|eukprot:CDW84371.1 UNKNOWN [Stylonychia lemnae]